MNLWRLVCAGVPAPVLAGSAAVAALSASATAPVIATPVAAPRPTAAQIAEVQDMLDRLPVRYALADIAARKAAPPR